MRLRFPTADVAATDEGRFVTVQFGLGTIGRCIDSSLASLMPSTMVDLDDEWGISAAARTNRVSEALAVAQRKAGPLSRLSVIWSAGVAGFDSDYAEAAAELDAFRGVVEAVRQFAASGTGCAVAVHLLSSAGGLYEGQTRVEPGNAPEPQRPYGQLKLAQEAAVRELVGGVGIDVYRPSSVFGSVSTKSRQGLVPTLVRNGLLGRVTTLSGAIGTQRDYVSARMVGRHIARRVLSESGVDLTISHLVAARPHTVGEVLRIVERALRRRVLLAVAPAENAAPITFSESIRAADFAAEDLRVGIEQVASEYLGRSSLEA